MAATHSLTAQLRRRIKDERAVRTAFRLECSDEAATDCLVSISAAFRLTTVVLNGREAANLNIDLTDARYSTVRMLVEHLRDQPGYQVALEQDHNPEHPSRDLIVVASMSIRGNAAAFRHHLFSDDELSYILGNACQRHNVNYTPQTLPSNEYEFVLMLAHSIVLRELASDAAKRRNLEQTEAGLLDLARDLEASYQQDMRRQARAIPVAKADENDVGTGDVMVGSTVRRSLRTGFMTPLSAALPPAVPELLDPRPEDVEDTKVRLRWERNIDYPFYAYELWRDTVPAVRRPSSLQLIVDTPSLLRNMMKVPFTAKLVYRSVGAQSRDVLGLAVISEQVGQLTTEFMDTGTFGGLSSPPAGAMLAPPLEPNTTYYYRLYVIGLQREVVESNVMSVTTKALRALMDTPIPITPVYGGPGVVVTVKGVRFTGLTGGNPAGYVTLGGKGVTPTIVNDTTLTFVVPTFYNPLAKNTSMDLVIGSPNTGLIDVYAQGFKYTGA